jgi:hypothetical protein
LYAGLPTGGLPWVLFPAYSRSQGVQCMAARTRKIRHDEDTRAKIQAAYYINRLHGHIEGKISLAPSQITAIKILLDKSLPNLSDVKIDAGAQGVTFNLNSTLPAK